MGKIIVICGVVALVATVVLGITYYQINRDINGWKSRAQVSSEPNDMLAWMTNVKEGMDKYSMTEGYAAIVFKTPENDMALIYHTVLQHISQAEVLTTMDRSSPQYQTGLDNLRGSIRELNLHAWEYWARHSGLIYLFLSTFGWIVFVIGGFIWIEINR